MTHLLKVKEDQHLGVVEAIREELSNVPVDPTNGFIQGQVLRLLQEHREDLEEELEAVTTAKDGRGKASVPTKGLFSTS